MQIQMNTQKQSNPNFGYFKFSDTALKHFQQTLTPRQMDKFEKIVEKEAQNKTVKAIIDYNKRLYASLGVPDKNGSYIYNHCSDFGVKGFFSILFQGELGFLKSVSRASSKMQKKYPESKPVQDSVINSANKAN